MSEPRRSAGNGNGDAAVFRFYSYEHHAPIFFSNYRSSSLRPVSLLAGMDVADVIRKSLKGSALTTGYIMNLSRRQIHSLMIQGDWLVVDVDDGDMRVK